MLRNNAPPTDDSSPGTLRGVTRLGAVSTHEVAQALMGSRVPAIAPVYDVETFRLNYMTTDGQGLPILASGLLSVPTAASVIDLLYAARTHARLSGVVPNGQLFLVGYSEGGYATAAAHRALQTSGGDIASAVVGSAPGAGPLDVGAVFDELLRRVRSEDRVLAWLLDPDVLQNLGPTLRAQVRDELLKRLLPGDADVVFQTTFIDNFLANDRGAINRDSDVHDWRPATPVRLFLWAPA